MSEPQLTGTESAEIMAGRSASDFRADPMFDRMFADVEKGILDAIRDATSRDVVLELHARLQGLQDAKLACEYWIARGQHAEARLARHREWQERMNTVKRKLDRFKFRRAA